MPIYEYVCASCGHNVEVMQKMGELLTDCPACGRPTLKKRMSAPGFQLKGKGWYATDFRSQDQKGKNKGEDQSKDGAPPDAKSEAHADAKSEPPSDAKSEAKPAATGCGSGTCGCH
ncbi:MAG: FmdB family zinc ribbon protein [Acidiferrobacter sp.]